ncbi:MAG: hypothetical protein WAL59_00585 [Roseiarcus sp.]
MPSQVVPVIRRLFPHVTTIRPGDSLLHSGQLDQLIGITNLIKEIPRELITVSVDEYADFILALASIEENNKFRISRGHSFGLPAIAGKDFATIMYNVLLKCPDEFPPTTTTELLFITNVDLRDNIRRDIGAINRAISNAEWKAANVLAGSVIEALLHWRLDQEPPTPAEIVAATARAVASARMRNPGTPDRDIWSLQHFIGVSEELGLIKPQTVIEAKLTQDYRNLIHPGRSARLGQVCDRGTAFSAVGRSRRCGASLLRREARRRIGAPRSWPRERSRAVEGDLK